MSKTDKNQTDQSKMIDLTNTPPAKSLDEINGTVSVRPTPVFGVLWLHMRGRAP